MVEQPHSEWARRMDENLPPDLHHHPRGGTRHYDHNGNECTFGRWGELIEARKPVYPNLDEVTTEEMDRRRACVAAGVDPMDSSWWKLGDTVVGKVNVSTVWLGLDHQWGDGPPLIFETMVFGGRGKLADAQQRYATREQALAGHAEMVRAVRHADRWRFWMSFRVALAVIIIVGILTAYTMAEPWGALVTCAAGVAALFGAAFTFDHVGVS